MEYTGSLASSGTGIGGRAAANQARSGRSAAATEGRAARAAAGAVPPRREAQVDDVGVVLLRDPEADVGLGDRVGGGEGQEGGAGVLVQTAGGGSRDQAARVRPAQSATRVRRQPPAGASIRWRRRAAP
ncbi:hypothetical protein O1L60_35610 [Streptomyces diastatochromogenes]|nr:hypothetical protein [Streptomyces diastatochromogenes]